MNSFNFNQKTSTVIMKIKNYHKYIKKCGSVELINHIDNIMLDSKDQSVGGRAKRSKLCNNDEMKKKN